jgi:NAD(P)-dependent dehydrogenase (short-subunit alcohol dehydrogenase family)
MIDLGDKVTVVTGAAGGIGSQTVRTLAELGARIVATDLPGTGLDDVVAGLTADGFDAIAVEADVTDEDSVRSLIAATVEAHGRVDVVDNNAGATGFAEQDTVVTDMDAAVWDEVFAINARGPMLMCKHTIPHMLEQGGGSIVNISSGLSLAGDVICAAYGPGKAALNALTRYVASVYGKRGVRCNAILPGIILTERAIQTLPPPAMEVFLDHACSPRLGDPTDIANAVAYLASDAAAFVNGQLLSVDGGLYAHQPHTPQFMALLAEMGAERGG